MQIYTISFSLLLCCVWLKSRWSLWFVYLVLSDRLVLVHMQCRTSLFSENNNDHWSRTKPNVVNQKDNNGPRIERQMKKNREKQRSKKSSITQKVQFLLLLPHNEIHRVVSRSSKSVACFVPFQHSDNDKWRIQVSFWRVCVSDFVPRAWTSQPWRKVWSWLYDYDHRNNRTLWQKMAQVNQEK